MYVNTRELQEAAEARSAAVPPKSVYSVCNNIPDHDRKYSQSPYKSDPRSAKNHRPAAGIDGEGFSECQPQSWNQQYLYNDP